MTLVASAPAPLTATPTKPPAAESEAAAVTALIWECSIACTSMPPVVAVTVLPWMYDAISLLTMLCPRATPMETATPTKPNAAAREADPANAMICEVSSAFRATLPASMVELSIKALISV